MSRKDKIFMLFGILLVIVLCASVANAQQDYPRDISMLLTQPTEYTDGTTIQAGELRGALVNCWRNNDTANLIINEEVAAPNAGGTYPLTFTAVIPQPGTYQCVAFTSTVDGIYSDVSNLIDRRYTGKPLPPVLTIVMD